MPPATYTITDEAQIEAMTSPIRLEVLDAARLLAPCSIAEIAAFLGRAPDSLYYHIRELESVGLLEQCGKRETGRRHASLYRTAGKRFRMPFADDAEHNSLVTKVYTALLRLTERDFRGAIRDGIATFTGRKRNIRQGRIKGWLTPDEVREVHEHIDAIVDLLEGAKDADDGEESGLYAFTTFLVPIKPTERGRTE